MPEQISHQDNPQGDSEIHSAYTPEDKPDDLDFNEEPAEDKHEEQHEDVAEREAILLQLLRAYDKNPETIKKINQFRQDPQPLYFVENEAKLYNKLIKEFPLIEDKEDVASFFALIEAGISLRKSGVTPANATPEERAIFINAVVAHRVMLFSNLRLVGSIAAKRIAGSMTFIDLFEEGIFGLDKAIAGFDYTKGFYFSTYATEYITGKIQRAVANFSRTIRLPVGAHDAWQAMRGEMGKIIQKLGRDPSEEELVEELMRRTKRPIKVVRRYLKASGYYLPSLDAPVGTDESDDSTFGDMLVTDKAGDEDPANLAIARVAIEKVLHSDELDNREKFVLATSFGVSENVSKLKIKNRKTNKIINCQHYISWAALKGGLSPKEIAKPLGVSEGMISQLRSAALNKAHFLLEPPESPFEESAPKSTNIQTRLPASIQAEILYKYHSGLQPQVIRSIERHLELNVIHIVSAQTEDSASTSASNSRIDFTPEAAKKLGDQGKLAIAHWLGIGPLLTSLKVPPSESAVARTLGVSPDRLRAFIRERYYQPLLKMLEENSDAIQ